MDGNVYNLFRGRNVLVWIAPATMKPKVGSIFPSGGPQTGGTQVVIFGENLGDATRITVGGHAVVFDGQNTQLSFVSPTSARAGAAPVVITFKDGASRSATFLYEAPPLSISVEPASGPMDTLARMTIRGLSPFSSAVVFVGGSPINVTADAAGVGTLASKMSGMAGIAVPISVTVAGVQVITTGFGVTPPATATFKDTFQVSIGPDARSADFSLISAWLDGPRIGGAAPQVPQVSNNISPSLLQRIQNAVGSETVQVFVNLADPLALPLFPSLPPGVARINPAPPPPLSPSPPPSVAKTSLAAQVVADEMQSLIDDLTEARQDSVSSFLEKVEDLDITAISTFWLVNGFTTEVPLELISELAAHPDVSFIQLNLGEGGLSQTAVTGRNGIAGDELRIVRDLLNSDPYDNLGLNWGYIGIIDSGVRANHQMLSGDPGRWSGDCAKGGTSCWGTGTAPSGSAVGTPGYSTEDACSHGTSTLSIIRGSDQLGTELRGITRITTDSWKVFEIIPATGECGAYVGSIARAVQKAITSFDSLIVLELQNDSGPASLESTLANNAFDIGITVISAAGNQACHTDGSGAGSPGQRDNDCTKPKSGVEPDWQTVIAPGNAQKTITVGARNLGADCPDNQNLGAPAGVVCSYSGRGPSEPPSMSPARPNLRYKPDILGYTNVEAAAANPQVPLVVDATWTFGGTSAATPTIAALAMLYHNWMQNAVPATFSFNCPALRGINNTLIPLTPNARQVCPGHVYAYLLNSATNVTRDEGAGWDGTTGPSAILNVEGAGLPVAPTNGWAGWGEWDVGQKQTANIPLNIPVGACNLNTTIWWPENFFNAHSDLDLVITGPVGFPGVVADSRPSVWERQTVAGPIPSGGWVISVIATDVTVSSQPFYFAWSYSIGAGCP